MLFFGGGARFSVSTCNYIWGAARRLLLDQKDILSLGVHHTCLFKVSVEAYRLGILLLGQQPNGDTNDFRAVMTPPSSISVSVSVLR